MSNKFILYIAPFSFPDGGAAARRVYGNCLTLKAAGYDVAVASAQIGEYKTSYNGIDVYSLNERKFESLPRYLKHFLYFNAGSKAIQFLDSLDVKPTAIILYSGYSPYLIKLRLWCNKNKVKLIFDAVEWYDPPNVFAKYCSPYYLNIELAMRYLLPKCDGLIVISRYLKEYYQSRGVDLVLMPPTIDISSVLPRLDGNKSDFVKVCYAGSIGIKKDFLADIIQAIYQINEAGSRVQLHIAGLSFTDLQDKGFLQGLNPTKVKEIIYAYGMLSHKDSLDLVKNSDFSIVFRPPFRNVQAGFPTKFVESMSLGTPVIGNFFSDLELYLVDNVNGIVCNDYTISSLKNALLRCSELENLSELRKNARLTAEKHFDCLKYSNQLSDILN
ncbi:glycosyltransferase [Rheinheimera sp. 1928-s]|uniref:glycosyltransferase n=1 Tax=Rheinheimera sp. 1928-s TaxID=3033803 RepID=UPI00262A2198|nr:glycosyltransferase [Rheinheimera sp. 1928-s]MDF3125756.1 glycosyltransferase [Rheinheimera sp. 1928-s]